MTSAESAEQHKEAAERAMEATLWEDAAREYEAALSLLTPGADDEAALLTSLGACYWNLAEARTAWRTLRRAIALCRERGDGVGMAKATVEILRIWGPPDRHRAMADEALEALNGRDPYLQTMLMLFRNRYQRDEATFEAAMAIAEQHGFEDILVIRTQDQGWTAMRDGRVEDGIAKLEEAHSVYARLRVYEPAAGTLRGAGFATLASGHLDRGAELSRRGLDYARRVHLRFTEQLALIDLAGVAFARCEFEACRELVEQAPGKADFRGDLYLMWMTELSGDTAGALRQMIDPERAGGATTAVSQTHGGNASVLYHAGQHEAARRALATWAEHARLGDSFCEEAGAMFDCLAELGDDALVQEVHDALAKNYESPGRALFCTLQGRALAPARGALALRLGLVEEAERMYREGAAWCERERVPLDLAHCYAGLANVAEARGETTNAAQFRQKAASLYTTHGARLWLERLDRR